MNIALLDIDKTVAAQDDCWNQLDNKNANAKTPEFLDKLANLRPNQKVVDMINKKRYDLKLIVTGRSPEHYHVTCQWLRDECGIEYDAWRTVFWDDKLASREASYLDYVCRKATLLFGIGFNFLQAYDVCDEMGDLHCWVTVYEDDQKVLEQLARSINAGFKWHSWKLVQVIDGIPSEYD